MPRIWTSNDLVHKAHKRARLGLIYFRRPVTMATGNVSISKYIRPLIPIPEVQESLAERRIWRLSRIPTASVSSPLPGWKSIRHVTSVWPPSGGRPKRPPSARRSFDWCQQFTTEHQLQRADMRIAPHLATLVSGSDRWEDYNFWRPTASFPIHLQLLCMLGKRLGGRLLVRVLWCYCREFDCNLSVSLD